MRKAAVTAPSRPPPASHIHLKLLRLAEPFFWSLRDYITRSESIITSEKATESVVRKVQDAARMRLE